MALCFFLGAYGIARAYENTRRIGFGEYKKAVDVDDGGIRILDFEIMRNSEFGMRNYVTKALAQPF